ncbi:MAG TPA: ice-binding family protein [Gemmatimonadales bacterium]
MLALIRRITRLGIVIPCAALLFAACDIHSQLPSSPGPGPGPFGPPLGSGQTYGILAGSTVTCVGPVGTINADLGLWPGTAVTGFPTCTVSGTSNKANAVAQTAQGELTTAYNALAGMACGTTLSANLGGTTLAPGVYCSTSSQGLTGTVTFDGQGNTNATFVIQVASALTVAGSVDLIGGAQAKNVWWQVGSSATIGTGSVMKGNIVAFTSITLNDNATLLGRALARNGAVTLGSNNTITLP